MNISLNIRSMWRCALLCLGAGLASQALADPFALTQAKRGMGVNGITPLASGDLCIYGSVYDPEAGTSRARILMVRPGERRVLWDKTVGAPKDAANNRFTACRSDGKATYVGANVDTNTSPPLNQALVYLYKFDGAGKLLAGQQLVTDSRNAFVYDLDVGADGIDVVGMASNGRGDYTSSEDTYNAIYFARVDSTLKKVALRKLATGAYASDATVLLVKDTVLLGGTFYPARMTSESLLDDYAVSKIVGGKYQFSVRPQKTRPANVATAVTADREVVSLGYKGKVSHLTVVNGGGKVVEDRTLNSAWCDISAIGANANAVFAIREHCTDDRQVKLVSVDRKSGAERLPSGVSGKPVHVFVAGTTVYVISQKSDGTLLLQTLPAGA